MCATEVVQTPVLRYPYVYGRSLKRRGKTYIRSELLGAITLGRLGTGVGTPDCLRHRSTLSRKRGGHLNKRHKDFPSFIS